MKENNSPWLYQLARTRPETRLSENVDTDVLIVGGGIAGISTLYFTLKYTARPVCLIEAKRVGHGATGHNAGYVTSSFEKSYKDILSEYGIERGLNGIKAIEESWAHLDELIAIAGSDLPFEKTESWGAYRTRGELVRHLEDISLTKAVRPLPSLVLIAEESGWLEVLPPELAALCKAVPHHEILSLLETDDAGYLAAIPGKAAVTNSALLTDRVLLHCLATYGDRVRVYENSFVQGVELFEGGGKVLCDEYTVSFKEIVLATNGFEHFYIKNNAGGDIDTKFHHELRGIVGYMTGYLTDEPVTSVTRYFYPAVSLTPQEPDIEPYFYISRRNFKTGSHSKLVSIGGPEVSLQERELYFSQFDVDDSFYNLIDDFMKTQHVPKVYERKFRWHGLMGYTKSGLRLIGREPENPILLYNLGCNGIGILTSIYGGKRIADHLAGVDMEPSIFDPKARE